MNRRSRLLHEIFKLRREHDCVLLETDRQQIAEEIRIKTDELTAAQHGIQIDPPGWYYFAAVSILVSMLIIASKANGLF